MGVCQLPGLVADEAVELYFLLCDVDLLLRDALFDCRCFFFCRLYFFGALDAGLLRLVVGFLYFFVVVGCSAVCELSFLECELCLSASAAVWRQVLYPGQVFAGPLERESGAFLFERGVLCLERQLL